MGGVEVWSSMYAYRAVQRDLLAVAVKVARYTVAEVIARGFATVLDILVILQPKLAMSGQSSQLLE